MSKYLPKSWYFCNCMDFKLEIFTITKIILPQASVLHVTLCSLVWGSPSLMPEVGSGEWRVIECRLESFMDI